MLLREGRNALGMEQNLHSGSIAMPRSDAAFSPAYRASWPSFLYDMDRECWNGMYGFLKKDLDVKSCESLELLSSRLRPWIVS